MYAARGGLADMCTKVVGCACLQEVGGFLAVHFFIFNKRRNGKCWSQFIDETVVHIVDLKQNLHRNILLYAVA